MQFRKRKSLSLILGLVLLLSLALAGCGDRAPQQPAPAPQPSTSTPAAAPQPATSAPAPAPAPAGPSVVKIGFIGPLTGPNAAQGVGARNGAELAVRQANASGDFPYEIEMIVMDDASTPGTGAAAAMRITSDPDVAAAIGHWNSPVAMATIPIFKQAELPFIIWGAISPALTTAENYPHITRVAVTSVQENAPLAKFLMEDQGLKRWAIISDTSVYGKNNTEAWLAEAGRRPDVEVIEVQEIQVEQTDFRPALTRIKELNPDAIYFGGVVMEGALVRQQMAELGLDVPFAAISGIMDDKFVEVATATHAEGTVASKPGRPMEQLPGGPEFIAAYEQAGFREPAGAYGPFAYDAMSIVLAALRQVGPDPAQLVDAIVNIRHEGVVGTTTFDAVGQTTNAVATIMVVQDGKWVPWDESGYAAGQRSLTR